MDIAESPKVARLRMKLTESQVGYYNVDIWALHEKMSNESVLAASVTIICISPIIKGPFLIVEVSGPNSYSRKEKCREDTGGREESCYDSRGRMGI